MEIHLGNWRLVVVIRFLRVVLKFPLPIEQIIDVTTSFFTHSSPLFLKSGKYFTHIAYVLRRATSENWNEFLYYRQRRHPILQPTYFSLLGLINVQRMGACWPESIGHARFNTQVRIITGGWSGINKVGGDPHHFEYPYRNFSIENGKLRINDYGGAPTRLVLDKYADAFYDQFDPAWTEQSMTVREWLLVRRSSYDFLPLDATDDHVLTEGQKHFLQRGFERDYGLFVEDDVDLATLGKYVAHLEDLVRELGGHLQNETNTEKE